eukprot:3275373-Rhodomonas_salina.1
MAAQTQSPGAGSSRSSEDAASSTDQPMTSPLNRSHVHQSFISPEVRYSGGITLPPSRPPNAWNPKYVTPVYLDEKGPFEQLPVEVCSQTAVVMASTFSATDSVHACLRSFSWQRDEWQRTGRRADAGVRRFSAYLSY